MQHIADGGGIVRAPAGVRNQGQEPTCQVHAFVDTVAGAVRHRANPADDLVPLEDKCAMGAPGYHVKGGIHLGPLLQYANAVGFPPLNRYGHTGKREISPGRFRKPHACHHPPASLESGPVTLRHLQSRAEIDAELGAHKPVMFDHYVGELYDQHVVSSAEDAVMSDRLVNEMNRAASNHTGLLVGKPDVQPARPHYLNRGSWGPNNFGFQGESWYRWKGTEFQPGSKVDFYALDCP